MNINVGRGITFKLKFKIIYINNEQKITEFIINGRITEDFILKPRKIYFINNIR